MAILDAHSEGMLVSEPVSEYLGHASNKPCDAVAVILPGMQIVLAMDCASDVLWPVSPESGWLCKSCVPTGDAVVMTSLMQRVLAKDTALDVL